WAQQWQLKFNSNKCFTLHSNTANTPKNQYEYKIGNKKIEAVPSIRDLGVIIDAKLGFEEHLNTCSKIQRANKVLAIVRRSFDFLDAETLVLFYKTTPEIL
ncbi:hypothetical protein CAPTEDRAFT_78332, partial [Capitella teleta]